MAKLVLLIHGWPRPMEPDHPLYRFFAARGYRVVAPNIFEMPEKLTPEEYREEVKKLLGDHVPEVIAGLSFGGFLAPHVAKEFPRTKLVLVGAAPYFRPKPVYYHLFYSFLESKEGLDLVRKIRRLPAKTAYFVYRLIHYLGNPLFWKNKNRAEEEREVREDFEYGLEISPAKIREAIKLARQIDNCSLLSQLKNPALIFAGKEDKLMSLEMGQQLHQLLANSRLVVTPGDHARVFTTQNDRDLEAFLN